MRIKLYQTNNVSEYIDHAEDILAHGSLDFTMNSVDSSDSGNDLNGNMMLKRLGWKDKYPLKTIAITAAEMLHWREFLKGTFITVQITYDEGLPSQLVQEFNCYVGATVNINHVIATNDGSDKFVVSANLIGIPLNDN